MVMRGGDADRWDTGYERKGGGKTRKTAPAGLDRAINIKVMPYLAAPSPHCHMAHRTLRYTSPPLLLQKTLQMRRRGQSSKAGPRQGSAHRVAGKRGGPGSLSHAVTPSCGGTQHHRSYRGGLAAPPPKKKQGREKKGDCRGKTSLERGEDRRCCDDDRVLQM